MMLFLQKRFYETCKKYYISYLWDVYFLFSTFKSLNPGPVSVLTSGCSGWYYLLQQHLRSILGNGLKYMLMKVG